MALDVQLVRQRAEFESQLAMAALEIADQKAQFDCQMSKEKLYASNMKVRGLQICTSGFSWLFLAFPGTVHWSGS